jgi:hypothetical protein
MRALSVGAAAAAGTARRGQMQLQWRTRPNDAGRRGWSIRPQGVGLHGRKSVGDPLRNGHRSFGMVGPDLPKLADW